MRGDHWENYQLVRVAMECLGKGELSPGDWRFHFFSWWEHPEYRIELREYCLKESTLAYFEGLRDRYGIVCDEGQMALGESKGVSGVSGEAGVSVGG